MLQTPKRLRINNYTSAASLIYFYKGWQARNILSILRFEVGMPSWWRNPSAAAFHQRVGRGEQHAICRISARVCSFIHHYCPPTTNTDTCAHTHARTRTRTHTRARTPPPPPPTTTTTPDNDQSTVFFHCVATTTTLWYMFMSLLLYDSTELDRLLMHDSIE